MYGGKIFMESLKLAHVLRDSFNWIGYMISPQDPQEILGESITKEVESRGEI